MAGDPGSELAIAAYGKAVDFRDHDRYATREQALQALRRECPGYTADEYAVWFDRSVALLDLAHAVMNKYREWLWDRWRDMPAGSDPKEIDVSDLVPALAERCPAFSKARCRDALLWKFIWYELR